MTSLRLYRLVALVMLLPAHAACSAASQSHDDVTLTDVVARLSEQIQQVRSQLADEHALNARQQLSIEYQYDVIKRQQNTAAGQRQQLRFLIEKYVRLESCSQCQSHESQHIDGKLVFCFFFFKSLIFCSFLKRILCINLWRGCLA